ncbi:hypothetical protein [Cytobacillus firmus]|uniref:hypothetical protein n=1 Tax=Cytobacillus firmus TaxID=1399 RepID=UPI0022282BFC|nr:hypothetical protein [Cytobacillus firmus]
MGKSPNQALIRTGKAETDGKESEPGAHSDRKSRNRWERVRTRRSFGQKKQKTGRRSPNQAPLRTLEAENREKESELSATSDIRSRIRKQQVQT